MQAKGEQAVNILEQCANVAPMDAANRRIAFAAVDTMREVLADYARLIEAQNAAPAPAPSA